MNKASIIPSGPKAYGCIILAAILWGFTGFFNKRFMAEGISSLTVVMLRNFGSMLFLAVVFTAAKPAVFRVAPRHIPYFFGTGILSVMLFSVSFFCSQRYCTLAVASTLEYTAPAIVVILSAILWKEPITRRKTISLLLVLSGCMFSSGFLDSANAVTPKGFLLALASGFFYALYSIFSRYALKAGYSPFTIIVWTFIFAGLGSIVFFDIQEIRIIASKPHLIAQAFALILVSTVAPYLLFTAGLRYVESGHAAILTTLELATASLISVFIFGERMTLSGLSGILLILLGIVVLNAGHGKKKVDALSDSN